MTSFAPITARILLDSINERGCRLTTFELAYPRMIHAEIMTHRMFSRCSASSRAIPMAKMRERIMAAPAAPVHWGANQKGMQAYSEVEHVEQAQKWWRDAMQIMIRFHEHGEDLGLHKQIVNRLIEPWMTIVVILSGTQEAYANFFHLRDHKAAEPSFQRLARLMRDEYYGNLPQEVMTGGWHLPLLRTEDLSDATALLKDDDVNVTDILKKVSVGRCARVSYLTHEGVRDLHEDIRLHDQLAATANSNEPMHASPLEHVAVAMDDAGRHGNFYGWRQYRSFFEREAGPSVAQSCYRCGLWGGQHVMDCPSGPGVAA